MRARPSISGCSRITPTSGSGAKLPSWTTRTWSCISPAGQRKAESLVIATICALIALLALIFAIIQRGQKSFFSIALFSLATAVMLVAESQASLLIADTPLLAVFLIVDMAVAHGFLPWTRVPVSWGALAFAMAVVSISVWHYGRTQKALQELTVHLEQKVAERTERAEALARRESARSRLLALESSKSQKLAGVIAGIQDCFTLDQAFDLLMSALPALYLPMAGCFYRLTKADQYERVLSWGRISEQAFPMVLHGDVSHLEPTAMPVGHQSVPEQLCFFLKVEPEHTGTRPAGVLRLARPELPEGLKDYGSARIVA